MYIIAKKGHRQLSTSIRKQQRTQGDGLTKITSRLANCHHDQATRVVNGTIASSHTMEVHGLFVLLALFGNTSGF